MHSALREESVSIYLGRLSSRHEVEWSEVRSVVRWVAWLTGFSAVVSTHYLTMGQAVDPDEERVVLRYVFVVLCPWIVLYPCCVRHYLRQLPSCCVGSWSEVWSVRSNTWLLRYLSAWVSSHEASVCQPVDVFVEGTTRWYVLVELVTRIVCEPCRVAYYLGYLSSRYVVVRSEVAVVVCIAWLPRSAALVP